MKSMLARTLACTSWRGRSTALLLLALILSPTFLVGSAAVALPHLTPSPEVQERVSLVLARATTKRALARFLKSAPNVCIQVSSTTELCDWILERSDAGWRPLAAAISSDDRILVLCEIPLGSSPREADSCTAHPRRSNRKEFKTGSRHNAARHSKYAIKHPGSRQRQLSEMANQAIDDAQTIVELSRLVGQAPSHCTDKRDGDLICVWKATARSYGHGTLAVAIRAPFSKKLRMQCVVPSNGHPRAPGSCRVEIGA